MVQLRALAKISILVLMLASCILMFCLLLFSSFNNWHITLSTNDFGEGPFELALFFVATVGGVAVLVCCIKEECWKRFEPSALPKLKEKKLKGKNSSLSKKATL